ncbi:MAG: hypothetical protein LH650_08075, partial [Chloroflexi bacterium]|nr:hypothetical protein [Chloroflexota bacterium]
MQIRLAPMAWLVGLLVLATTLAGTVAGPAAAQGTVAPGGLGITGVAPPSWVQPGARITFYSAAAAVAQSSYQLIEDPAGPWQDPVTGKRYRNSADTGESVGGASGDGVSQVDVVAVEGNDVVLSMAIYGIDRATNTLSVLPSSGAKLPGGAIDGLWMAPQLLARLQT